MELTVSYSAEKMVGNLTEITAGGRGQQKALPGLEERGRGAAVRLARPFLTPFLDIIS